MKPRAILGLAVILVAGLMIGACEVEEETATVAPTTSKAKATVELTLNAHLNGDTLNIEGSTDLPDGAVIIYEISLMPPASGPIRELILTNRGATVSGGKYAATEDIAKWPEGDFRVYIAFQPAFGDQPAAIIERFGETGQHLEGFNVVGFGQGIKSVELVQVVARR